MERLYAQCPENFYPRPPRGERPSQLSKYPECPQFLSTPSSRRATCRRENSQCHPRFLSTPSSRRATCQSDSSAPPRAISIHALLAESDLQAVLVHNVKDISIHALLAESDWPLPRSTSFWANFYPRPPRGERRGVMLTFNVTENFYPRPPRGERLSDPGVHIEIGGYFYPRPPRGERLAMSVGFIPARIFLSTPSSRRATLRATSSPCFITYFYPRPPRGERPGCTLRMSAV